MKWKVSSAVLALAAIFAGCDKHESATPATSPSGSSSLVIAVIPKGTTHEFWKSVDAGAQKAGKETEAQIVWKGPLLENDRAQQIAIVEQFVSQGVGGIVVAPLDNVALKRPIDEAMAKKIPVVIIDSALEGEPGKDFVSFVATDNKAGGVMAGEQLATLLGNKGKVVLLRYGEGSASTLDREAGFLEAVGKHPDLQVIVQNRYAGPTMGDAKSASMELVDKIKEGDGIFCSNESATSGMLLALRQLGLVKTKKFVGFDASPMLLDALKAGEVDALVAQNPSKMGYEGVKTLINHIHGQTVPQRIDSGAKLITLQNLNDPDTKELLGIQ